MLERDPDALDKKFEDSALERAKKNADEEACIPNQLLSRAMLIERYKNQLVEGFSRYRKGLSSGVFALIQSAKELGKSDLVTQGLQKVSKLKNERSFNDQLEQGLTLQQLANIDDASLDALYEAAKHLYEAGRYEDAENAFQFLTCLNPKKYAFWLGLAGAQFYQNRFEEASKTYSDLVLKNPNDTTSHLLLIRCFEALGDFSKAVEAIEHALQVFEGMPENVQLINELASKKAMFVQQ